MTHDLAPRAARASAPVNGARARTRAAILEAAVGALATDPHVPLGRVAELADVGRTTLHRYFPERSDLLDAVGQHAVDALAAASARARTTDGTALEALLRVAQEYLGLGDLLTILLTGLVPDDWEDDPRTSGVVHELCVRGVEDGSLDPRLPPEWTQGVLWAGIYLAWSTLRTGTADRHAVVGHLLLTLRKAVGAPPS